ncbi:MAG: hypothetical protein KQI35_17250 [Bacteroidetes bacterium]|nr:hypothetical protein [Bacteroidota bacterium]
MPRKKRCPVCNKTDQVIPIIYGFPDESLFIKADKGEVILGGCVIVENNPEWYCKRDDKRF